MAREVVEGDRSIASVAASYGLVAQRVGNWVAKYRKQHADAQEQKNESEAQELARLKAELHEARMEQ
ncbi:transposase [Actinomyces qiguomingii]|uniref:transposase n=1 Tax=Actinomyces qiguomingii TaxID=2057800 RepID=UPI000C9FFE66|nr:transposase [Actinomyces qiguomingii]